MNALLALAISLLVAGGGFAARALTATGAAAAVLIGTAIVAATGVPGLLALGTFFAGSTFVSRIAHRADPESDQGATEVRDHWQVLANGGAAGLGALAEMVKPGLGLWLAAIGLAAAGSDTWSTAFGRFSTKPPCDILSRRPVSPGESGGVTAFGTVGGLFGASLVALAAAASTANWKLYAAATLIGFGSMVFDSALGSARQARYWCSACEVTTERRVHRCGRPAEWRSGWRWLDNNAVNAVATAAAVLAGWLVS